MKHTLIALDLDATLLHDDHTISEKTIKTIKSLKSQGATIAVSTSRDFPNATKYSKLIDADFICANGGNMIAAGSGKILYVNFLPKEESDNFINTFYPLTNEIYVDNVNGFYGIANDKFTKDWLLTETTTQQDLLKHNAIKLYIKSGGNIEGVLSKFCAFRNWNYQPVRDFDFYVITPKNSDKYFALEKIMKKYNLTKLIAFGDDYSDLLSLQKATYGVAMANSRPEVFEKAKYRTKSNNEDGVAIFLERFLEKEREMI